MQLLKGPEKGHTLEYNVIKLGEEIDRKSLAPEKIRTCDLLIGALTLHPLCYDQLPSVMPLHFL